MKNALKRFLRLFGLCLSYIIPYSLTRRLQMAQHSLYSSWIAPNFKSFGNNTKIETGLYLVNGKHICIGSNCIIGRNSFITAIQSELYKSDPKIIIGDGCIFGADIHITAVNKVSIGNNVRTGKSILISDNSHGKPSDKDQLKIAPHLRPIYSKGEVIIGDNVWIGEKAAILPGVTLGNGSIIGANSVVTKDIPANSIAVGMPAKIILNFNK